MPVTARLSQRFYEKLGEEATTELVNLLNSVDERSRNDLQDINQRNWEAFRAELRALDARWDARTAEHNARLEKRFAEQDARWEKRITELDAKWEKRITELDAKWEKRFSAMELSIERVHTHMAETKAELMRWMFIYWSGTLVTLGGLMIALRQGLFG